MPEASWIAGLPASAVEQLDLPLAQKRVSRCRWRSRPPTDGAIRAPATGCLTPCATQRPTDADDTVEGHQRIPSSGKTPGASPVGRIPISSWRVRASEARRPIRSDATVSSLTFDRIPAYTLAGSNTDANLSAADYRTRRGRFKW